MRLDDIGESDSIEDRRGEGGGFSGIPGGGGGLGFGAIVGLTLLGWAFGINPALLIGGAEMVTRHSGGGYTQQQGAPPPQSVQDQQLRRFVSQVLKANEDVWQQVLPQQKNLPFRKAPLVLFRGGTQSGCGPAQSEMGPFYCPRDQKIYLDMSFFAEMQNKFRAGGDFAYAYVVAHEMGHHIENLLGILPKVHAAQQRLSRKEANALSVRVELMADCLAGVWAYHADQRFRILEQGDVEEALAAASAIGDDKLQKRAQGYVVPDSFTHGTAEQRSRWLTQGLRSGRIDQCDTFNTRAL